MDENQYVANENTIFVPSKILKIFPDAQGVDIHANGKGTSQFIFQIPDYLNFINPETLRLRFNMKFSDCRGMPKPNPVAAANSLFRHMRTQSINSLSILEEIDEYSSYVGMTYSYSQDDGIIHDRELNEGLSLTNNSAQQLFWSAQNLPSVGITAANTPKSVALSLPVHSGVLGRDASVLPVAALGGVKLTMETNSLMKSIKLANNSGKGEDKQALVKTQVAAGDWNNASLDHLVGIVVKNADSVDCGFEIGDAIYYDVAGVDTLIGLVVSVDANAGDTRIQVRGDVPINTDWKLLAVDTPLYTKAIDRFNGWTPGANMSGTASASITLAKTEAAKSIDYTITDLEMIVEQLQPPESYTNELVKKLNSREGLVMVYRNSTLQKVNLIGTNGVLSASIPNQSQKVYAINIMPLNSTDSYNGDNLTAVGVDGAQNYQFVINDVLVPDQRCPLRRMTLTPPYVEQLHLQELRKSLVSSGVFVRSLQNAERNFVIGRAVSMYGAVSDITKSDLSVRIEYDNAVRQKTLNCYVCSARTMVIRPNEVQVIA